MKRLNNTKAKQSVLQCFEETQFAVALSELTEILDGKMNRTTLYRILDKLEEINVIHSIQARNGKKYFARNCKHNGENHSHLHFECSECGRIKCIVTPVKIPPVPNYRIHSSRILVVGKCDLC